MGARSGRLDTLSVFSHTTIYHRGNYKVNGKIGGGLWFQSGTKLDLREDYNSMELTDRIYRRGAECAELAGTERALRVI
jgi:hypothetical protein